MSARTITARVAAAAWTEPLPGVIDLGTHERTWRRDLQGLVLAAGPEAWASHDTAAHLHRFLDAERPERLDVTVFRGRHTKVGDHRLRTTASLGADEVTEAHGIPCTIPARTVLDLAVGTDLRTLERYVADLARRDAGFVETLVELTDRHRRLPGRRRLLDVVARLPGDVGRLGSPVEVLIVQELIRLGAPPFVLQYQVRDLGGAPVHRADVAWPDRFVLLEIDGAAYHDLRDVRRKDERTRARMGALGWYVEVVRRADLHTDVLPGLVRRLRRGELGPA
ncbi:hypothetical protein [Egicoccus sp. AB-alg2]|uniref:hypothetical protein n=1 Tax=Egicoccus sp. AB-alg2 TaxID=3242693 RepID=UPI00359E10C8